MAKKIIPLIALLVIFPNLVFGSIAFDASSSATANNVSSLSWAHTVTSNTDGVLLVGINIENGATPTVSTVTYNGDSLTRVSGVGAFAPFGNRNTDLFCMELPDTGTHNIVVTLTGASGNGLLVSGLSYTGVDSCTPDDYDTYVGNPTGDLKAYATTTIDNDWLVGFSGSANSLTAQTGTTIRESVQVNDKFRSFDSAGAKSPTGTYNLYLTQTADYGYIWIMAISPVTATSSGTSTATTTSSTDQSIQNETYATILFVTSVSLFSYMMIFFIKRLRSTRGRV